MKRIKVKPRKVNATRARSLRLKREYGISLEDYGQASKLQKNRCAICKRPASQFKVRLAVDHCHKTGLLRGLLCYTCNKALGVWADDVARLQAAVDYLQNPVFTLVFGLPKYTAPGRVGTKKRAKLLKQLRVTNA